MPPSAASSSLRSAGLAFRNAKHQTAKVGAEGSVPERGDDDAEAEHDSPARDLNRATTRREDLSYARASRPARAFLALS